MSSFAVSLVWEASCHKESVLLTLLALADYADENGQCWPSIEQLATRCRLSKRQVQRNLITLEESGELFKVERGSGRGRTSNYRLNLGALMACWTLPGIINDIAVSPNGKGDISPASSLPPTPPILITPPEDKKHPLDTLSPSTEKECHSDAAAPGTRRCLTHFLRVLKQQGVSVDKSTLGQIGRFSKELLLAGALEEDIIEAGEAMIERGNFVPAWLKDGVHRIEMARRDFNNTDLQELVLKLEEERC
jgi:hypothetical protein